MIFPRWPVDKQNRLAECPCTPTADMARNEALSLIDHQDSLGERSISRRERNSLAFQSKVNISCFLSHEELISGGIFSNLPLGVHFRSLSRSAGRMRQTQRMIEFSVEFSVGFSLPLCTTESVDEYRTIFKAPVLHIKVAETFGK